MKHLTIYKVFTAFLLVGLILSACDGVLPGNVDLDSSDNDSSFSNESSDLDDINDDDDDDNSSSSSDDDEIFTSTVEAVDGNTVTIDGQVYTVDLGDGLLISDYLIAGQSITYTIDDDGEEIKIFIGGLGEIELKLDDDDDDDDNSSSNSDDDEVFTSTVEAVDGNTVTIDGQVYTVDLGDGLLISDYLTAGQSITYTIDDDGEEIKIFIDGLGEIELELDNDDDHDGDSNDDHDIDSNDDDQDDHSSDDGYDDEEHDSDDDD